MYRPHQLTLQSLLFLLTGYALALGLLREGGAYILVAATILFGLATTFSFVAPVTSDRLIIACLWVTTILVILLDICFAVFVSLPNILSAVGFVICFVTPFLRGPSRIRRLTHASIATIMLVVLATIDWDGRKTFKQIFTNIRPGMAISDVEQLINSALPDVGARKTRRGEFLFFTLSPPDGPFNAETISIRTTQGVVNDAQYLPD